jgi:hypothetical protein
VNQQGHCISAALASSQLSRCAYLSRSLCLSRSQSLSRDLLRGLPPSRPYLQHKPPMRGKPQPTCRQHTPPGQRRMMLTCNLGQANVRSFIDFNLPPCQVGNWQRLAHSPRAPVTLPAAVSTPVTATPAIGDTHHAQPGCRQTAVNQHTPAQPQAMQPCQGSHVQTS